MALNDDADKLDVAEDYLLTYAAFTQEFDAALEHVLWVHKNKPECRPVCARILKNVIVKRSEDKHVMAKMRRL